MNHNAFHQTIAKLQKISRLQGLYFIRIKTAKMYFGILQEKLIMCFRAIYFQIKKNKLLIMK